MAELTDKDKEFIKELREARENGSVTRREALGALAGLGIGGAASYSAMGSASAAASTSDGDGNVGTPSDPVDVFAEGVDANSLNKNISHRHGAYVYYDARNRGPYTDGQDALADVPVGGLLHLAATDYDVATEGRLLANKLISITGEGWVDHDDGTFDGTNLINTGADVVDSPVIEFSLAGRERHTHLSNLHIQHEGSTSPAVKFDNSIYNNIYGTGIDLGGTGSTGIQTVNEGFFTRVYLSTVKGFTNYGIHFQGLGSEHVVVDCHTNTSTAGSVGVRTERPGTRIMRGQIDAVASGVEFNNPSGAGWSGGTIAGVLFEKANTCIDIDGTSRYNEVMAENIRASLVDVGEVIRFGNTDDSHLIRPTIENTGATGNVAHWTTNARQCSVVAGYNSLNSATIVDDGATQPAILVPEQVGDARLGDLPTGSVPVTVAVSDSTHNHAPVWHDGASWRVASNTTFSP